MRGGGSVAILEALPMPLGSTIALFMPPAFAGPGAMPLIGTFPEPASPAIFANDAVGEANITRIAKAIFVELFDMGELRYESLERRMREADLGLQSAVTTKFAFRKAVRYGHLPVTLAPNLPGVISNTHG
jgi:hypothetical protein